MYRPREGWTQGIPFQAAPPLEPVEVALLWDADKLAKVGPIAQLHYFSYYLSKLQVKGESATTRDILTRQRYWFDELTPKLLASFNTVVAQRRATQLHAANELFWQTAESMVEIANG